MTSVCGNCGKDVAGSDVTCPHCDALLAAWTRAPQAARSNTYETPDYARPPEDAARTSSLQWGVPSAIPGIPTSEQENVSLPKILTIAEREAASRLITTISAYIHQRELQASRVRTQDKRVLKDRRSGTSTYSGTSKNGKQISNIAFVICTVLIVVLVIMWGIVARMVVTDMVSLEFVLITVIPTLGFKPTFNRIRSSL